MAGISLRGVQKVYGDGVRAVDDLELDVADGELLVLLGPSGCGKTTVLRLIAGLETPTRGEIHVGARRIDALPPGARDVAMIFQDYALYPHKTVAQNLAFPLRMRRTPRGERERRVGEVADLLDLGPLLGKRPSQLSGGQKQRVAIGRALVREPAAFLMDEPLANLDARLRERIRTELRALQRRLGITTIFVTHDQSEAMTLGHRIAVLRRGRLHQVGTPDEIYRSPEDLFVASFVGQPAMNLLRGELVRGPETWNVRVGDSILTLPPPFVPRVPEPDPRVVLGLRPEALRIVDAQSDRRLFAARVRALESLGPERLVHLEADPTVYSPVGPAGDEPTRSEEDARLIARMPSDVTPPSVGEVVGLEADPHGAHVFDVEGSRVSRASSV